MHCPEYYLKTCVLLQSKHSFPLFFIPNTTSFLQSKAYKYASRRLMGSPVFWGKLRRHVFKRLPNTLPIRDIHQNRMNTVGKGFLQLLNAFLTSASSENVASKSFQSPDCFEPKSLSTSGHEDEAITIATNARYTHKSVEDLVENTQRHEETKNISSVTRHR